MVIEMQDVIKKAVEQCYADYRESVEECEITDNPELLNLWAFKEGAEWLLTEMHLNNDIDEETFLKYIREVV